MKNLKVYYVEKTKFIKICCFKLLFNECFHQKFIVFSVKEGGNILEEGNVETELYELRIPGKILGKEVVDGKARRIGIVRSIRVTLPSLKVELIIKGLDVEFPVDVENISAVGSVVQLKTAIKEAEEIELHDVLKLRKEILAELRNYLEHLT